MDEVTTDVLAENERHAYRLGVELCRITDQAISASKNDEAAVVAQTAARRAILLQIYALNDHDYQYAVSGQCDAMRDTCNNNNAADENPAQPHLVHPTLRKGDTRPGNMTASQHEAFELGRTVIRGTYNRERAGGRDSGLSRTGDEEAAMTERLDAMRGQARHYADLGMRAELLEIGTEATPRPTAVVPRRAPTNE